MMGPFGNLVGKSGSILWGGGLERKGMQRVADMAAQRLVDHLVLLNPALTLEGGRYDQRGIVIAVTPQILDGDLGVGQALADQPFDCRRIQSHELFLRKPPYRRETR